MRDEYRTDYDIGRGGYGMIVNQRMGPDIRESDKDSIIAAGKSAAAAAATAESTAVAAAAETPEESEPTPMAT